MLLHTGVDVLKQKLGCSRKFFNWKEGNINERKVKAVTNVETMTSRAWQVVLAAQREREMWQQLLTLLSAIDL